MTNVKKMNELRFLKNQKMWFGLVGSSSISNIVGYLMPNSLYTYLLNMISKNILHIIF